MEKILLKEVEFKKKGVEVCRLIIKRYLLA